MEFEKHVKVRQEKFGAVIFETLREKVFVTNETGADILKLFEKYKNPQDVINELAKDYNCNPEVIKLDVEKFVSNLKDNKIVN